MIDSIFVRVHNYELKIFETEVHSFPKYVWLWKNPFKLDQSVQGLVHKLHRLIVFRRHHGFLSCFMVIGVRLVSQDRRRRNQKKQARPHCKQGYHDRCRGLVASKQRQIVPPWDTADADAAFDSLCGTAAAAATRRRGRGRR